MMKKPMVDAMNKQMNAEFYSEYLYLSMAAYFESINLFGFAHWMKVQAVEEHGHAMEFFDHIAERLARVEVSGMAAPPTEWKSPLDAFQSVLGHEIKVTGLIHKLVEQAAAEKDYATGQFLQRFVEEQVDEESNADTIVEQLKMSGDSKGALLYIDHELGKRKAD